MTVESPLQKFPEIMIIRDSRNKVQRSGNNNAIGIGMNREQNWGKYA